ncbi:universal stress protein [bacterium]|nr:universal stress protein [candidate division CSSED10-310 bacterium]
MDPLKNRRSLPVQLRVLIPISYSDRYSRLLKLIHLYFPAISTHLYVLAITDQPDHHEHLLIRQKLQRLIEDHLGDFHCDLLIRCGKPGRILMGTAIQHRCDLILLANNPGLTVELEHLTFSVPEIIRKSPIPILLVPDPEFAGNPRFPIQTTLIQLNGHESSRLSTAFALRTARLLSNRIVLTAPDKCREKALDYMTFIRDRYWPSTENKRCRIDCFSSSPAQNLRQAWTTHEPDMLIVILQDLSFFHRHTVMETLKNMIPIRHIPVMLVNRHDWVKQQEAQFSRVYNQLTEFDLVQTNRATDSNSPTNQISEHESELLMGCYSIDGLNEVFRQYGLFKSFAKRGYPDVQITFNRLDHGRERLRVFPGKHKKSEPLVDLVCRKDNASFVDPLPPPLDKKLGLLLYIDWLCLQDPQRAYRDLEIPLPGQKYPGLGMGWKVMLIIKLLAHRIGAGGVYNMPEYYHTARLYHRYFHYLDPSLEGRLLALDRDTFPLHVVDTSWAALHGLILQDGKPMRWIGGPQVLAIKRELRDYFNSTEYNRIIHQSMLNHSFTLDIENLSAMMKNRCLYREPSSG